MGRGFLCRAIVGAPRATPLALARVGSAACEDPDTAFLAFANSSPVISRQRPADWRRSGRPHRWQRLCHTPFVSKATASERSWPRIQQRMSCGRSIAAAKRLFRAVLSGITRFQRLAGPIGCRRGRVVGRGSSQTSRFPPSQSCHVLEIVLFTTGWYAPSA